MPKLSAIKLVDRAILPAVLVMSGKLIGVFLASLILGLPWEINWQGLGNNFLFINFTSLENFSAAINFSDTIVVLVCGLGFSWSLFQARHLNINHSHPTLINRIIRAGKELILTDKQKSSHQNTVWLSLTWLTLFLVLVNVYQGLTSNFVLGLSLAVTLGLTYVYYDFVRRG